MPNTITLPNNISFEEIALKWCEMFDCTYCTAIVLGKFKNKGKIEIGKGFFVYEGDHSGHVIGYSAADYLPPDRKILIRDEEKFQPILDYIKERSHGQN